MADVTPTVLGDPDAAAVVAECATVGGARIGILTLNAPCTLNALSRAMIDIAEPQLQRWAADPALAAVWLQGSGARAFCAGGDIQALYHAMVENHAAGRRVNPYAEAFFAREYRLDHYLRVYPKPIVVWGEGVVMGGGMGLFGGATFRIVSATSRLAMPEINIGLFADAGGTACLAGLRRPLATWLGLSGAHLNARDALDIGLASHALAADRTTVIGALAALPLTADAATDRSHIGAALAALPGAQLPAGNLARVGPIVDEALADVGNNLHAARAAIAALAGRDSWLDTGIEALERGCPTTAGIVLGQIERAPALSLADMFRLETTVATHCARNHDFAEGVRALLIDKDRKPRWQYGWDTVTQDWIDSHFEPPWPEHPLADLGP